MYRESETLFFLFDPAWNNEEKITHTRARARASLLKKMLKDLRWNETRTRNKNRKSQKKNIKQASKHVLSHELNKNEFQGQIFQSSTLKTVFFAHTRTRVHKHFQTVLLLLIISLFLLLLLFLSKFVFYVPFFYWALCLQNRPRQLLHFNMTNLWSSFSFFALVFLFCFASIAAVNFIVFIMTLLCDRLVDFESSTRKNRSNQYFDGILNEFPMR